MIPKPQIAKWKEHSPWKEFYQIEQDLIISRVLVEIFSDEFLNENLAFRGDMEAILRSNIVYDQEKAFDWIKNELIEKFYREELK